MTIQYAFQQLGSVCFNNILYWLPAYVARQIVRLEGLTAGITHIMPTRDDAICCIVQAYFAF